MVHSARTATWPPSERFFHRFNHQIWGDHLFAGHSLGAFAAVQAGWQDVNGHFSRLPAVDPSSRMSSKFGFVQIRTGRFTLARSISLIRSFGQDQFRVGQQSNFRPMVALF